jgi:hypothetical protein
MADTSGATGREIGGKGETDDGSRSEVRGFRNFELQIVPVARLSRWRIFPTSC